MEKQLIIMEGMQIEHWYEWCNRFIFQQVIRINPRKPKQERLLQILSIRKRQKRIKK